MTSFAFLSDLHGRPLKTPSADVLVCAGDMTDNGLESEFEQLNVWFGEQQQERKLYVPGNHDILAYKNTEKVRGILSNATMVIDQALTICGAKFYFSPWVNTDDPLWAFPLLNGTEKAREVWKQIPEGLDVLVTHGPPYGISDQPLNDKRRNLHLGCGQLKNRLEAMAQPPKFHVFGHFHEGARLTEKWGIKFLNVSICDIHTKPTKGPFLLHFIDGNWSIYRS